MTAPLRKPLFADRRLHGLLLLAVALRFVVGIDVWSSDPTARALLSDSVYYRDWALALLGRAEFAFEGPDLAYWMPPLYARLLAWMDASVALMLVFQGLLGLVTTLTIVAFADLLFDEEPLGRRAALFSGLLWTLYGPVIFFEGRLLGASLATCLAAVALYLLLRFERSERKSKLAFAGLALGLMSLVRPNTLLALPAVALWILWRARRGPAPKSARLALQHAALLLLPALAALTPALLHNVRATGNLVPITANGGVNFYFGNNPESHGTFHAPGPEWGSIQRQRGVARQLAASGLGRPLAQVDDVEASRYWFGRGLDYLTTEPLAAARLMGLKLADLLSSTEFGIQYNLSAARSRAPSLWLVGLPFGVLLFLAALGWRRSGSSLVLAWLVAGLVSALAYFTYSRFRLPLLPTLIPFCGLGLAQLLARRCAPRALFVGLVLLVFSFVPFEGSYPKHLTSHAYVDMAAALAREPATRPERAALLDAALSAVPGNKPARVARGLLALESGDTTRALAELEAAVALPVDYPAADFELARLLAASPEQDQRDRARARELVDSWLKEHSAEHPDAASFRSLQQALTAP